MDDNERNNTPERKAYMKAYADVNREAISENKRAYERRHPERAKESKKRYREANRDKKKAYHLANKERLNAKFKAYYQANKERMNAQNKAYRDAHREEINIKQNAARYGVSPDVVAEMSRKQDHRCAICKTAFTLAKMNVDHCHDCGEIRGLLCAECNRGLSCFKDNPKSLRRAIKYLADWASKA